MGELLYQVQSVKESSAVNRLSEIWRDKSTLIVMTTLQKIPKVMKVAGNIEQGKVGKVG